MLVKTSLLRFSGETVNCIRKGLEREYELERRLKMDSMGNVLNGWLLAVGILNKFLL